MRRSERVSLSQARPDRAWESTRARIQFTVGLPLLIQLSPRMTPIKLQRRARLLFYYRIERIGDSVQYCTFFVCTLFGLGKRRRPTCN